MMQVQWNQDLAVGIELVDTQHQALIERLNRMAVAVEERQGEREIARTLGFLIDYTHYHFSAEEGYMEKAGYPELPAHRLLHKEFTTTLDELKRDFEEEGSTKPLARALNAFLGNWLVNHIRTIDRKFGVFLAEKGIEIQEGE